MNLVFLVVLLGLCCDCRVYGLTSEEAADLQDSCCAHGERQALGDQACAGAGPPDDVEEENLSVCLDVVRACCSKTLKKKEQCDIGAKSAPAKKCFQPKTDIGKMCCEECALGRWSGGTEGAEACGEGADEYMSTESALRKNIFQKCCLEKAREPTTTTTTTTTSTTTTTTPRPTTAKPTTTTTRESCKKKNPCEQVCKDDTGVIVCQCKAGYKLKGDGKSCRDVNECAETLDELCNEPGTVCHNTAGSYRCVPLKKRDVGNSCPPGFKRNFINQACDDVNECQLPRPPCPKYLCENTMGGFKCAGKPGSVDDDAPRAEAPKTTLCPPGFRDGPGDECHDIDECAERLDDCQRLSQYCINSRGSFFCQDHVSRRCAPGFVADPRTGVCGDIDECEEGEDACPRGQVCVNFPGAYDCKSKISTLPKLGATTCQEGTRAKAGGTGCEDIDECREGTHLCDQFQQCVNTFGGHECRCKTGFELDSRSDACVDIDECSLNIHTCSAEQRCVNVLGSFTCARTTGPAAPAAPTAPRATSTTLPPEEYEYYYSDEDNSTIDNDVPDVKPPPSRPMYTNRPPPSTTTTARAPTTRRPAPTTRRPATTTRRPPPTTRKPPPTTTTRRPTTTPRRTTTTQVPTTTERTTTERRVPPRPRLPPMPNPMLPPMPAQPQANPMLPPVSTPPSAYTNKPLPTATFEPPVNPLVIEGERRPDGSYSVNTDEIPKDRWTNVVGRGGPGPGEIDPNKHCIDGTVMDEHGECVDVDECSTGRFLCGPGEVCRNAPGGYSCDCAGGLRRDARGWCVGGTSTAATTSSTAASTTSTAATTTTTTESTTTESASTTEVYERPPPRPRGRPRPRPRPTAPPLLCEMGYQFDYKSGRCVDVDECATGAAACGAREECVNSPGGYRCECGARCRDASAAPSRPNTVTVGSQYGQRGPRYKRPKYSRLPGSGAILINCPWGYKLTEDRQCADVDECATRTSECAPEQTCNNFYGGYSCQCPAGHRLNGEKRCEDIDECEYGNSCPAYSTCVNSPGSFSCACGAGLTGSEGACADVDECVAAPCDAEQTCVNVWGGYRCVCGRGLRGEGNGTCEDIDECQEAAALGRRMCLGQCVNTRGGYQCRCPAGYRLAADERSCIDIDECETGEAPCARGGDGSVCQNTRGGYHCHQIDCPPGYNLVSKHECARIRQQCSISDWDCLSQPSRYSYNFITFAANVPLPTGSVDLLTVQGPSWPESMLNFELQLLRVHAPAVRPAGLECFQLHPTASRCVISLVCSLAGPQVAELELTMTMYQRGMFSGKVIVRPVIIVSEYEY